MAGGEKDPEFLSTLERGLRVLRSFDEDHSEMTLSEVASKTSLSPAVARRCLNTLVELGYVGKHGRNFLLRPQVLTLGSAFLSSMHVEHVCLPALQHLRDETGDSASLSVLSGCDILYVAHVTTDRRFRLQTNVGTRYPFHATSMGKVIAAFGTDELRDELFANAALQGFTSHTVTRRDQLEERFERVRERGYDSALDELDYGIVSVAIPVFDKDRQVVAAINCSTSTTRISQDELVRTRLPLLREAGGEIERALKQWPAFAAALKAP